MDCLVCVGGLPLVHKQRFAICRCVLFRSFRGSSMLNTQCDIDRFLHDWTDFFQPYGTLTDYRVHTYVLLRTVTESLHPLFNETDNGYNMSLKVQKML